MSGTGHNAPRLTVDLMSQTQWPSSMFRALWFGRGYGSHTRSSRSKTKNRIPDLEAIMYGSRSEHARARARQLLAQIAPLPDDLDIQRLRELSVDYIREAEILEKGSAPEPES